MTTPAENMLRTEQYPFAELYEIVTGTAVARYTSYHRPLIVADLEYKPATIRRSGLSFDTAMGDVRVTLTSTVLAELAVFIANNPTESTLIRCMRAVTDALDDWVILFQGPVVSVGFEEERASATISASGNVLNNILPPFLYQARCNHFLFDTGCQANKYFYEVQGQVVVSGSNLVVAACASYDDGYFTQGFVEYQNDSRLILKHVGNTLTLHVPFDSRVYDGVTAKIYPGCDGSPETCKTKYNNWVRFVGMPMIPSKSPVVWGI